MLKRLAIFVIAALIAAVVLMARYDENYNTGGKGYDIRCEQPSQPTAASTSFTCAIQPSQNAEQSKPGPPWWHKLAAWPDGITAWLLMLTLGAIVWQAWETRKAADAGNLAARAAFRQAEIQQESLRPRLTIGFTRVRSLDEAPYSEMIRGEFVLLNIQFINTGGIPAYGVIAETWVEWLRNPYDFTPAAVYHKGKPLTVHPTEPTLFGIPFRRRLTPDEIAATRKAEGTICLRVRLTYLTFGKEAITQVAYSVEPDRMSHIPKYAEAD